MTTNDRLKVFLIGVPGGALLIAGLLSINSDSSLPRLFISVGVALIVVAQLVRWRAMRR
ncbi:MAG: hypothetical protein OYI31_00595 [Chloroflexota bacterium]|nr:hypothetical protein [Chloroflexota bacterium]MDE2940770.1 hypothetical protein [Chloroflexota bacterium]MDE3266952.1 hypothetical protein [Chloroflexota bacterium]